MSAHHLHRSGIIRVSEQLLKMKDPSEKEEQAAQEMLRRFSVMFPDEGDDAAD